MTDARGDAQWPEVELRTVEPDIVVFMRHIGPYPDVAQTWIDLEMWIRAHGLVASRRLAIAYDDPELTPADKLRYDACVVVDRAVEPEGRVGTQVIVGGEYAVLVHRGAFSELGRTFAALYGAWLPASGREPRHAPPVLRYLTALHGIPPEQLRTEVCVPLASIERSTRDDDQNEANEG